MPAQRVLEGTWEEIKLHEAELKGRRLRVIIEPLVERPPEPEPPHAKPVEINPWLDIAPRPIVEPPEGETPRVVVSGTDDESEKSRKNEGALPSSSDEQTQRESFYDTRA